ncbi:hypothetical protein LWI29_006505 [Acer saccharum]|uniref:Uncharacterized protein n=1 Tax=Acer saccharum TaxID=4024 RepID=A0AA39SUR3_ACESA|nr:hypothetical protein LWI29_006505 [Acer saccharum]
MEGLLRESLISEAKPLRNGSSTTDMSKRSSKSSTTTAAVVFSTLVAVCGSFCHGCASGYSSLAESGIMEDLDLSVATIFPINVKASAGSLDSTPDQSSKFSSQHIPINVKAPAGSLMTLVSWSCFWIVTYTFNFMLEWSSGDI